jgi:hypothetical protein
MPKSDESLTLKQERWVNAYLETGNATEAARIAGYKGDDNQLGVVGHENLRKLKIRQRIEDRLAEADVTPNEVIKTLASHMRLDATELFDELGGFRIDYIRENKLGHLIKKLKCRRMIEGSGDDAMPVEIIEVELHNSQTAAAQLCKVLGIEHAPKDNDTAGIWQEIAEHLSTQFNVPIEQVRRDLAAQKPELASTLLQ